MMFLRTLLTALPIILVTSPHLAAEARLTGKLETDRGVAVQGLPVIIQGQDDQAVAISDDEGQFEVDLPKGGEYSIIIPNQQSPRSFEVPSAAGESIDLGTIMISPF